MLPYRENMEDWMESSPLRVLMNHRYTAGWMVSEHWHPGFELLYVFGGEAEQTVGSSRFPFRVGDTLLIPPGMVHATRATQADSYIGVTQFNYDKALTGYYLPREAGAGMDRLFSHMQEESVLRNPGWRMIVQGILFEVMGLLERYGEPLLHETAASEEGQRLEEYLRLNLTKDLSLQSAAAFAGYSPTYFSRYFSHLMGMPFKQYVDRMKMQAACGMLADGLGVAAVASTLGYETASSFCRAFKRMTGQTPSEYQNEGQEMDIKR